MDKKKVSRCGVFFAKPYNAMWMGEKKNVAIQEVQEVYR
jgi:hypothetical protein